MKCLFVHDLRSYYYKDQEYTTNFSYEIIKTRYLCHFDEVRILNRSKNVEKPLEGKYVKSNGINVSFVNEIDMFSGVDFFIKKRRYAKIVSREVNNADFVIIRLDSFLGLIAIKFCKKYRKKYMIEVAGCVWDSFWNKGIMGKILAPILFYSMKRVIKNASYVVYVTTNFLQNRYPTLGKSIACSNVMLNTNNYSYILNKRINRIESKKQDSIINIATIAAVDVTYKNQQAVIKALGILKRNNINNFIYNIIGGGNNQRLKKIADKYGVSDLIVFYGSRSHTEIFNILDETDIYIQPSKQEGLPRALIEAMSRGCMCYGSKVAGIPELLQSDFVFDIKNASKEISRLLQSYNAEVAVSQAKRNIRESKKYFSEILEKRRYDFIEEAIK